MDHPSKDYFFFSIELVLKLKKKKDKKKKSRIKYWNINFIFQKSKRSYYLLLNNIYIFYLLLIKYILFLFKIKMVFKTKC